MKKYILFSGIVLFLMQCSSTTIKSTPEKQPIVVDGHAYDWEKYPVEYNEDWHLVYGAVNSDSTLYLVFSFNGPQLAKIIARRGITLWLGEDKKFGIKYIDNNLGEEFKKLYGDELYTPNGKFSVVSNDSVISPDLNSYPEIKAQFGLDKGLYCFEFSLPLHSQNMPAVFKNIISNKMRFGFELAKLSDEFKERMREGRSRRRSGDDGNTGDVFGGRGGGMRGRMDGRMGDNPGRRRPFNFEGKELWFTVNID